MNDSPRMTRPLADVERAKYLWEEYRYRHDLIWKLMFRMTTVAVLLSIAPFTINDVAKRTAGAWVNALPALALALVAISGLVLRFELALFTPINRVYTAVQDEVVDETVRKDVPTIFGSKVFESVVRYYPAVLFLLLLGVALILWTRD